MTRQRGREARILLAQGVKPKEQTFLNKKTKARKRKLQKEQMEVKRAETLEYLAKAMQPVVDHQAVVRKEKEEAKRTKAERKARLQQEQWAASSAREADAREKSRRVLEFQALLRNRQHDESQRTIEALKEERLAKEAAVQQEEEEYRAAAARGEAPTLQCRRLVVPVKRPKDLALARERLPILSMEGVIMDELESDSRGVMLVCGATGSGKTTQMPQFLYEAGFSDPSSPLYPGMIGVTQPRRVAALTTAQRVAEEMSFKFGREVGYQVRYVRRIRPETRIKFMTEGILLKEMQSDLLLRRYSVIILDEAHERSINTDLLIGLLSRIVPLRQELYQEALRRKEQRVEAARLKGLLMEGSTVADPATLQIPVTPLKLVIMSATLQVKDFTENERLFNAPPPVVNVDARQFPVTTHFAKRTPIRDYLKAACRKVCQIHERLPPGGLLVFCSTQREIELLGRMLTAIYRRKKVDYPGDSAHRRRELAKRRLAKQRRDKVITAPTVAPATADEKSDEFGLTAEDYELSDGEEGEEADAAKGSGDDEPVSKRMKKETMRLVTQMEAEEDAEARAKEEAGVEDDDDDGDEDDVEEEEEEGRGSRRGARKSESSQSVERPASAEHYDSLHVLPLYALLPQNLQRRVFQPAPADKRLCVIATNVAETSITIPGIRYVLDLGRVKAKQHNAVTGVMAFQVTWTSQASADQRAGRAGRTCPGHCYRLYTTAVYSNLMNSFTDPEIASTPLDSLVLFMKSVSIQNISNFPFPTPIDEDALVAAMKHLRRIQALDMNYRISDLGRELAKYPLLPRYARMLHLAQQPNPEGSLLGYMTVIVSCLSNITDIFVHVDEPEENPEDAADAPKATEGDEESPKKPEATEPETEVERTRRELRQHREADMQRRQAMYAAHRKVVLKYSNPGSDLMTCLEVTRHYMAAEDKRTFCRENFLVERNMREAIMLRAQLMRLLSGVNEYAGPEETEIGVTAEELEAGGADASELPMTRNGLDFSVDHKPTLTQEAALRKLIAAGLVDHVARRATASECQTHKARYLDECLAMKSLYIDTLSGQPVWVHPFSSVSHTQPCPEFVCYSILQSMKRPRKVKRTAPPKTYMKGVTILRKEWLWELGLQDIINAA